MNKTEVIKNLINETGLNMKAFSQKAGLPYSTLRSMLERGVENASVNNVIKVCSTLNITIEKLYEIAEKSSSSISKEEKTLLENYNKSNDEGKKMILSYSDYISQNHANVENEITTTNDNVIKLNTNSTEEYTLAAHDDELDEETKQNNLNRVKEIFKQMDEE